MLEIAVGPPHIVTNQGHTVLVTEPNGQIPLRSQKGLYFRDTRLLSHWSLCTNGQPWELLNSGNLDHYASRVFLTNRDIAAKQGTIPHHTLQLVLSRSIDEGMHENLLVLEKGREPLQRRTAFVVLSCVSRTIVVDLLLAHEAECDQSRKRETGRRQENRALAQIAAERTHGGCRQRVAGSIESIIAPDTA